MTPLSLVEPNHLLTSHSWRQRRIGLLVLAITSDECLRRYPRVEVGF